MFFFKKRRYKFFLTYHWLRLWNLLNTPHGGYLDVKVLFKEFYDNPFADFDTFPDILFKIITEIDAENDKKKVKIFLNKTHLSSKLIADCKLKIENGKLTKGESNHIASMKTIISIIMGLGLSDSYVSQLFSSCGISFIPNHIVSWSYKFLLNERWTSNFQKSVAEYNNDTIMVSNQILSDIYADYHEKFNGLNEEKFLLGAGVYKPSNKP